MPDYQHLNCYNHFNVVHGCNTAVTENFSMRTFYHTLQITKTLCFR